MLKNKAEAALRGKGAWKDMKKTSRHWRILTVDPWLKPYAGGIDLRMERYEQTCQRLLGGQSVSDFANGYLYYGFHRTEGGWVYREWAPGADEMHLLGDFNGWDRQSHPMRRLEHGDWEIELPGEDALVPGQRVLVQVTRQGQRLDRVPAYIHACRQDPQSHQFDGVITDEHAYVWHDEGRARSTPKPLLIYECHIGMAQEDGHVGTYEYFTEHVLPRVKADGYNAIQLMAVQEHAYYASFGYQVTNFFAASSWYGAPDGLKKLIDTAHRMGLRVLLDLVHSHASLNSRDGLADFDGSGECYCRGTHPAWGSALLDYGRPEVAHFLLSNIKYWMCEYHFDGFRFDGVTSMLYHDHSLGRAFTGYDDYFTPNVNYEALSYLQLATRLIHEVNPGAVAICEEMSGMPGMCLPIAWGGAGFDYRLNMGVPDLWIRLIKHVSDQDWNMGSIWYELSTRRPGEKTVGYCESHDQALVGDQTIIFRLMGAEMYGGMHRDFHSLVVDRGMALSKLIRLITCTVSGDGYLNFMGNEFGHPEWIDFPREGNGWSGHYARRQWSLADNPDLKYAQLGAFDREMTALARHALTDRAAHCIWVDEARKVVLYIRGGYVFAFNFHPTESYPDLQLTGLPAGKWRVAMDTDEARFGGFARISHEAVYETNEEDGTWGFKIYLPSRTALVLAPEKPRRNAKVAKN